MSSKSNSNSLDGADNEPFLAKKIRLEHKLISEKTTKTTQTLIQMNMKPTNFY